jgi:hypothetical protein
VTSLAHIALAALLASAAPAGAHDPAPELVSEALFLADALPPGGRDLSVSVLLDEGEPDARTGETSLTAAPRLQLAMALGDRVGFTADTGLDSSGAAVDSPGASLKLLLREPRGGRLGLAASVDLFGSTRALEDGEAGLGLGAIRQVGRVALRGAAAVASPVGGWSPHLHAGVSAAVALGERWRLLGEVVSEVAAGEAVLAAGPTVKVTLGERTAVMAGALFEVSPASAWPAFTVQLTRSL